MDWPAKLAQVNTLHHKVARMRSLSQFGLSLTSNGYSTSKATYHAEFGGLPSAADLGILASDVARLVDGRWPRADRPAPRLTGISQRMQVGHPSTGGFGVLPFQQHIQARWARWAVILACSSTQPDLQNKWWVYLLRLLLQRYTSRGKLVGDPIMLWCQCGLPPAQQAWLLTAPRPRDSSVVTRFITGMRVLPKVQCRLSHLPDLGPWCAGMPLWDNCLLESLCRPTSVPLATYHGRIITIFHGRVQTIGDAVRFQCYVDDAPANAAHCVTGTLAKTQAFIDAHLGGFDHGELMGARSYISQYMQELLSALPQAWVAAAREYEAGMWPMQLDSASQRAARATAQQPLTDQARQLLMDSLVWPDPDYVEVHGPVDPDAPAGHAAVQPPHAASQHPPPLPTGTISATKLTVKQGTLLQLDDIRAVRRARHIEFVQLAVPGGDAAANYQRLRQLFQEVWQLKWENRFKSALWQLAVDGIRHPHNGPMQGRDTAPAPRRTYTCGCGGGACSRLHHFWQCPVAQAVVNEMRLALPGQPQLTREHVWLAVPPPLAPGSEVHMQVWLVACLAALTAIESGRKYMAQQLFAARARAAVGTRDIRDFMPGVDTPAQRVARAARRQFWANVTNFASKGVHGGGMERWAAAIPPDHPFLGVAARRTFVVNAHVGADVRADLDGLDASDAASASMTSVDELEEDDWPADDAADS